MQRTVKVGMIRILIREKEELRHERIEPDEKKKAMSMDKIVHDSLHYFEENGYYNTSIEMLCEKAMISRTTFFNYFGNKEKLIKLIMEDGLKDLYEMIVPWILMQKMIQKNVL